MKLLASISLFTFLCCSNINTNQPIANTPKMNFTEKEILDELDLAYKGKPGRYFPAGNPGDIKYNFFLDLENAYCVVAGSRIHLYADSTRWAIVFETSGYETRQYAANITLDYMGNCIEHHVETHSQHTYISNCSYVTLITQEEYERIRNREGSDMEQFEFISAAATEVTVRDTKVPIEHDPGKYEAFGIKISDHNNPKKLVGYGDLVRYLHETNPAVISATETEIKKHIPADLPKIITIDSFHFVSLYETEIFPGQQETYQLLAKVLVNRDTAYWKPTMKANNHWSNWLSGNL